MTTPYQPEDNRPPHVIYVTPPATNGLATGSMVAGIASVPLLCLCYIGIVPAIIAIILGFIALSEANKKGGVGKHYAITGIVCGAACILLIPVVLLIGGIGSTLSQMGNN